MSEKKKNQFLRRVPSPVAAEFAGRPLFLRELSALERLRIGEAWPEKGTPGEVARAAAAVVALALEEDGGAAVFADADAVLEASGQAFLEGVFREVAALNRFDEANQEAARKNSGAPAAGSGGSATASASPPGGST